MTNNQLDGWDGYYGVIGAEHSSALERAVREYCKERGFALDIGAGNLRDTKYLLKEGFVVTAIDPAPGSVSAAETIIDPNFTFFQGFAGAYEYPQDHFSIINAQHILFHFPKDRFDFNMEKIQSSLKQGGILCANFLGENDTWNREGTKMTITPVEDLKGILKDFEILYLKEHERDQTEEFVKAKGDVSARHEHQIVVIARKK